MEQISNNIAYIFKNPLLIPTIETCILMEIQDAVHGPDIHITLVEQYFRQKNYKEKPSMSIIFL